MSKEQIYDEQINPLMAKIMEICRENKIAMIADFMLDEDLACTTAMLEDSYGPRKEQLEALRCLEPRKPFAMAITEETKPNGEKKITMRRV